MKTYIQNMSKKNLAIAGLIAGFLIGVLVVGIATIDARDGGRYKKEKHWGEDMKMDKSMKHGPGEKMNMMNADMDMDMAMDSMAGGLIGKTGNEFDRAFLSMMIVHHEGAIEMAKQVLATSKRPELLKLANEIITAQNKEVDLMHGWLTDWYKN